MAGNKRIPELPQIINPGSTAKLAIYDDTTDVTKYVNKGDLVPGQAQTTDLQWNPAIAYIIGNIVEYDDKFWQAVLANTNTVPVEGATWTEVSKSASGLTYYAAGVFTEDDVFVVNTVPLLTGYFLLRLVNATRPFNSTDFTTEYNGGDWEIIGEGVAGIAEVPILLASSTDDPTSGHVSLQGVVIVNGTTSITDQNTLSLLWYIDYGSGYALADGTGSLAGLKTDLETNMLLASDKANVRYVATEQVSYLGDMVNGFFVQLTS